MSELSTIEEGSAVSQVPETPSFQARIITRLIKLVVKRWPRGDYKALVLRARRVLGLPGWTSFLFTRGVSFEELQGVDLRGEWVIPDENFLEENVLLYLHGGGYVSCTPSTPKTAQRCSLSWELGICQECQERVNVSGKLQNWTRLDCVSSLKPKYFLEKGTDAGKICRYFPFEAPSMRKPLTVGLFVWLIIMTCGVVPGHAQSTMLEAKSCDSSLTAAEALSKSEDPDALARAVSRYDEALICMGSAPPLHLL
jgi:hypothetical protein